MIDFNQEHPFKNAIGKYLLYNRGKQSKSKWKLDAKQPFEDYKKRFLPKLNKTSTQWAIKCGRQLNGSYIIGIDFDIYGQNQENVVKHEETQSLFDDFLEYFGSKGVWESGTEGNYGCCVDISEDKDLCNLLEEWKKPNGKQIQKFEINNVEFLIHTLHLLPPTKSICKRSKKLRARKCLEENDVLPRKADEDLLKWIRHNVETKIGETTKEVIQQVTQVLETIQKTPEKKIKETLRNFGITPTILTKHLSQVTLVGSRLVVHIKIFVVLTIIPHMTNFAKNIFKLGIMQQTTNHRMTVLMWMATRQVGGQYINGLMSQVLKNGTKTIYTRNGESNILIL